MPGSNRLSRTLDRSSLEKIAELFRVFSEATRLAILQELKHGPRSVTELVESIGSSQANVSKQLRILFEADLLHREKTGNQVIYSIKEEMIFQLCELVCDKLNRRARESIQFDYRI